MLTLYAGCKSRRGNIRRRT